MSRSSTSPRPSSVLVVDDDDESRALLEGTLRTKGYEVTHAGSGAEALVAFERKFADCVLVDVRMPGVDGIATCERLRALPRGGDAIILFLTGLRDVDTFDRALRAGGDDFITKPALADDVLIRVETALKLRELRAKHREHHELLKRQHDGLLRLQLERERLMAFVVHDLKTPVSSMDLHAQLMLREPGLPKHVLESLAQIRSDARQLNRMILNLLDVTKACEGGLSPKRARVDLRASVADIVAELEVSARARGVTIVVSMKVATVEADEDLLRRMLANLIDNAIRHAPHGGEVNVAAAPCTGGVELRVTDRGVGIPPDMVERVFDAFVQADGHGRPRAEGGRGLGLTFCKVAALAHGGRIWIEDAAPGAEFCVTLPATPSLEPPAARRRDQVRST